MSYDQRSTDIMKCAKEKLKNLSPEDRNDADFKVACPTMVTFL